MDSARNGGNTLSWKVQSNTNDVMHSGESVDAIIQSKFSAVCFLGVIFFVGVVFFGGVVFVSVVKIVNLFVTYSMQYNILELIFETWS